MTVDTLNEFLGACAESYTATAQADGSIAIDARKCGMTFSAVVEVHDPTSANPLIAVRRPLGINAVTEVLFAIHQARNLFGIGGQHGD